MVDASTSPYFMWGTDTFGISIAKYKYKPRRSIVYVTPTHLGSGKGRPQRLVGFLVRSVRKEGSVSKHNGPYTDGLFLQLQAQLASLRVAQEGPKQTAALSGNRERQFQKSVRQRWFDEGLQ